MPFEREYWRKMDILKIVGIVVVGYLCGSFSTAILLTKRVYNDDIRNKGSKNAGATNVARVYGLWMGLATLVGDMIKTAISAGVGHLLFGEIGVAVGCAACIIGHCFPIYYGFKGGKGVSVGACIALVIDWRFFLILLAVFIISFLLTKTVSICSICCAISFTAAYIPLNGVNNPAFYLCLLVTVLVCFMHRENMKRIVKGEEKKFKSKSAD